jgi:hypothetical protein
MKESLGEYFVQEFVIGLGLLGGLGVNPEGMIIQAIAPLAQSSPGLHLFLIILPFLITALSLVGAFSMGGWIGIIAVGLAFFGGLLIQHPIGVWLIVFGFLLGFIAPSFGKSK